MFVLLKMMAPTNSPDSTENLKSCVVISSPVKRVGFFSKGFSCFVQQQHSCGRSRSGHRGDSHHRDRSVSILAKI
jgi:hypothetical protein